MMYTENEINFSLYNNNSIDKKENSKINFEDMKELLRILRNQKSMKSTEIALSKDYLFLIHFLDKLNEKEFIQLLNYLNSIEVPIIKILINGFISFYFIVYSDELISLQIISKTIKIFLNKNIFYFIYGKLSNLYRNHKLIKDIEFIENFGKIFKIWKILYNTQIITDNSNENINTITFFPDSEEKINKNIIISFFKEKTDSNLPFNSIENVMNNKSILQITLNFLPQQYLLMNKYIDNFSFLKLYNKKGEIYELNYNDILTEENTEIEKIKFCFNKESSFILYINDLAGKILNSKCNYNFQEINKIEILNNFLGEITSIIIEKDYIDVSQLNHQGKSNLKCEIKKNIITNYAECKRFWNFDKNNNKNEDLKCEGEIFSIKKRVKKNSWNKTKLDLKNIKFFGGLECIIPIFKILKYIICKIEKISKEINNNINNNIHIINNYINAILEEIKDILKIIIKMICLSSQNYTNFKKIIVPLIGSLSEIINILSSSDLISKDNLSLFLNNEVFFILYIIILNTNLPDNIKKFFKNIFGINFKNYTFKMNLIIFDLNEIKNLNWYFSFIFNIIEFMLIIFGSKIPKDLIDHLSNIVLYIEKESNENKNIILAMNPFINLVKNYCLNESININDIFLKCYNLLLDNKYYWEFIINMIKTFLNAKRANDLNVNNENKSEKNHFYIKFQKLILFNIFGEANNLPNPLYENKDNQKKIINIFNYYINDLDFLQISFHFLTKEHLISKHELLMDEIIDYHGEYHHLMKELFIFNRMWSNQNLFFNHTLDKMKNSKLKYKNINYYTRNFQRPIIYPILDYKNRYPIFSSFIISKDLYNDEEYKDDYNFELDCPNLDKFFEDNYKIILGRIKENGNYNINLFDNVCLIKNSYHIKGTLFFVNELNELMENNANKIIYFISYSYDDQNNITCNKSKSVDKNKNNNLCYGSTFKCSKKDIYRKIKFYFKDIRLIMKRNYYLRNSAIEIYTETKSYYFNLNSELEFNKFFDLFIFACRKNFFPININGKVIGFIKINHLIIEKYDYMKLLYKNNYFLEFMLNHISKRESFEMCTFDMLLLINIISNRSFQDLHQYPIFPLLYFWNKDKKKLLERDLNEHIGLHNNSKESKLRSDLYKNIYKGKAISKEDERYTMNINNFYFNTHYSNIVYTVNYLIRLIPYSYLAIELQGDGFDTPNRLFSSIDICFYNVMSQKSDIRELIPEFFYLPEIFMNINNFNFHKTTDNVLVNDVVISEEMLNCIIYYYNIKGKISIKDNRTKKNNKNKKDNYKIQNMSIEEKYCIFIDYMKNKLEGFRNKLSNWINLIFGTNQKFNEKNEQYFRNESYIDLNKDNNKILNNSFIMESVEFGVIPLQTIFDSKILNNIKKINYEKIDDDIKNKFKNDFVLFEKSKSMKMDYKKREKIFDEKRNEFLTHYYNKTYWEEKLDINFIIDNNDEIGKLVIKINNKLTYEIIDHNEKIIDTFYNRRLNMFATTSFDGFICIYILPNKLISMIKNSNNSYFEKIFLSSNPFPTIIAFDRINNELISYSLSGIIIKELKIENDSEFIIIPLFNMYGGIFKDKIILSSYLGYYKILNIPFFNVEKEDN